MRVFVTGGDGQLAQCLKAYVGKRDEFYFASKKELDITNKLNTLKVLSEYKPDIVLHFAAKTRGEDCAKNPEAAQIINIVGTKNIVAACNKLHADLLFISTNEVFNGKSINPYSELDIPHPKSVVGKQKYKAECIIKEKMTNYYIVRTMWLYSEYSSNFIQAILKKARERITIRIVEDEVGVPTSSHDVARAIMKLIHTKKYGIYHIVNKGEASRFEFAKYALDCAGITKPKLIPIKLRDFKRISPPPAYSAMISTKLSDLNIELPKWQTSLSKFIKDNKDNL